MLSSTGGRRLVLLLRRTAASAAGGAHRVHPQPLSARPPNRYFSTVPLARTPDADTTSYLIASCGLSHAGAATTSRWFRIRSAARADEFLALLRRHGFSGAQIARLLRSCPSLLNLHPDKTTRPKLEFFSSLGVPPATLSSKSLLMRSLEKHLVSSVDFLRGILGTDADVRKAVACHYSLIGDLDKNIRPALEALRSQGLDDKIVSKLLTTTAGALLATPSRIGEICKDLEAIGLPITDSRFPWAFCVMGNMKKETWLRKVALFQSLGVSEGDLLKAFKKQASIMLLSEENIRKKFRFFLQEMKLQASDVMGKPVVLGYSLEKAIIPRCAVLSVLMREGKIEKDINLLTTVLGTSNYFSEKYVLRYAEDVPDVVKAYEGKIKFEGFKDRMFC